MVIAPFSNMASKRFEATFLTSIVSSIPSLPAQTTLEQPADHMAAIPARQKASIFFILIQSLLSGNDFLFQKKLRNNYSEASAGTEGLEPSTFGFGDQRSTD